MDTLEDRHAEVAPPDELEPLVTALCALVAYHIDTSNADAVSDADGAISAA